MKLDLLSWLIWLTGIAIFILWIIFPAREFLSLFREKMRKGKKEKTTAAECLTQENHKKDTKKWRA